MDEFEDVLAEVRRKAGEAVLLDGNGGDPERAHVSQDEAAEAALRWTAAHSVDQRSKQLAAEVVRAFSTGGTRWYA